MTRSKAEKFGDWMVTGVSASSAILEPLREKALEAEAAVVHGVRQGINYVGSHTGGGSPALDQAEAYAAEAAPYAVRWGALGVIGLSVFRAGRDVYRHWKDSASDDSHEVMSNRPEDVGDGCGGAYEGSGDPPFREMDR